MLRCCFGVEDTLADVLAFIAKLFDADRLCTDEVSLALLSTTTIHIMHSGVTKRVQLPPGTAGEGL